MLSFGWPLAEMVAHLLERDEREAVLGDLSEAGESAWHGLLDVLGLVIRRQVLLWRSWRPWLAGFGLALPSSFLLMGTSVAVSLTCQQLTGPRIFERQVLLVCQVFLLTAWSWSGGFVVGRLSRQTLWASVALCFSPCLFCLVRFRIPSLSRFSLLVFLLPAIVGVFQGLRSMQIRLRTAIALAVPVTALMVFTWSSKGLWVANWSLIWPVWYIVATAQRSSECAGR